MRSMSESARRWSAVRSSPVSRPDSAWVLTAAHTVAAWSAGRSAQIPVIPCSRGYFLTARAAQASSCCSSASRGSTAATAAATRARSGLGVNTSAAAKTSSWTRRASASVNARVSSAMIRARTAQI